MADRSFRKKTSYWSHTKLVMHLLEYAYTRFSKYFSSFLDALFPEVIMVNDAYSKPMSSI